MGSSSDIVLNCYNVGNIQSNANGSVYNYASYSGGIAGYLTSEEAKILTCYNLGKTTGENCYGISFKSGITVETYIINSYFLTGTGDESQADPLTEPQMRISSSFVGFDFDNVWIIDPACTYPYPQLRDNRQVISDTIPPAITGITDQAVYCAPVEVTVTDDHLASVTVNGVAQSLVEGKFTLQGTGTPSVIVAADESGNQATMTVTVNNGHSFGGWLIRQEATCTETGVEYHVCSVCGYEETQPVPALGHDYADEWTIDKEPTCTEPGSKSRHCSRCDAVSDVTRIPASGHQWGEWITEKDPSITEDGLEYRLCSECGEREERPIPAYGYIPGDADGDGKLTGKDLLLLQKHINNWDVELVLKNADVNGDGKINAKDLLDLQKQLNNWQ